MGDLTSGTSLDQKDPTPVSRRDGEETVHDKLPWSLAGEEETRETEKSFITPELAEIHLPAQGGENTSSGRLQVAVQRGEGVEEIPKLNENPNLEIQSLRRGIVEQQDKMARERQDSAVSCDRELQGDKDLRTELCQVIGTLHIKDLK